MDRNFPKLIIVNFSCSQVRLFSVKYYIDHRTMHALRPLLHPIYINDLSSIMSSLVLLFTNDCTLYRNVPATTDLLEFQKNLKRLTERCHTSQMRLSIKSVSACLFCRSRSCLPPSYFLYSAHLDFTVQYKYLRLTGTPNNLWSLQIHNSGQPLI